MIIFKRFSETVFIWVKYIWIEILGCFGIWDRSLFYYQWNRNLDMSICLCWCLNCTLKYCFDFINALQVLITIEKIVGNVSCLSKYISCWIFTYYHQDSGNRVFISQDYKWPLLHQFISPWKQIFWNVMVHIEMVIGSLHFPHFWSKRP